MLSLPLSPFPVNEYNEKLILAVLDCSEITKDDCYIIKVLSASIIQELKTPVFIFSINNVPESHFPGKHFKGVHCMLFRFNKCIIQPVFIYFDYLSLLCYPCELYKA